MRQLARGMWLTVIVGLACSKDATAPGPSPVTVATVTVSASVTTLLVGQSTTLTATPKDSAGHMLSGLTVSWASSNVTKASITPAGIVTALDSGDVQLTATISSESGSAGLTIHLVPIASIALAPRSDTLAVGDTVRVVATLLDSAGHPLAGRTVSFASSNPGKASVTPAGLVTALDSGDVQLSALAAGQSDSITIKIHLAPVASINLTPRGDTLAVGDTVRVTATLLDSAGRPLSGRVVTFTSSNPAVVDVSSTGLATMLSIGTATISAVSGGVADSVTVLVPPCVTSQTLSVNQWSLPIVAGGIRSTSNTIADGRHRGVGVLFGAGPVFGTNSSNLVIGYDPTLSTFPPDLAPAPVCLLQTGPIMHTYAKLVSLNGAPRTPNLSVTEESFAYSTPPDDGYVLFRYVFTNTGATPITGLTAGYVLDWDLSIDGYALDDIVRFNTGLKIGEVVEADTITHPQIMAVVPIASGGTNSFHGYVNGTDPAGRSAFLTFLQDTGPHPAIGPNDVRELMGRGPYAIPAHGHVVVYFAIVGGDNRSVFASNVAAAVAQANALGL